MSADQEKRLQVALDDAQARTNMARKAVRTAERELAKALEAEGEADRALIRFQVSRDRDAQQ